MSWFASRRRRQILAESFPEAWQEILARNVRHFAALDPDERDKLRAFVQVFVAEKTWEGCGGLELDDEMRVTIAAQAGLLVLGRAHDYYRNVNSILVYPSTIVTPDRPGGAFEIPHLQRASGVPILGEAQLRGPVLLVWDAVKRGARHPELGHDVVYHEFAHKLDMLDGAADGTPPLANRAEIARWVDVCGAAFNALRARVERGEPSFLDVYGATNEAEFFAVATEYFFDRPVEMRDHEPDLYALLRDFYGQDPAARSGKPRA
jgi:Mlc titration factor MtfA (ptsG expression regulator)